MARQCSQGRGTGKPERYFEGSLFYFIPEGTSVADIEEVHQPSVQVFKKACSKFFWTWESFWCDLAKLAIRRETTWGFIV